MECSSRPHNNPARLIAAAEDEIGAFRRQRLSGPNVAKRLRRPISSIGVVQPDAISGGLQPSIHGCHHPL